MITLWLSPLLLRRSFTQPQRFCPWTTGMGQHPFVHFDSHGYRILHFNFLFENSMFMNTYSMFMPIFIPKFQFHPFSKSCLGPKIVPFRSETPWPLRCSPDWKVGGPWGDQFTLPFWSAPKTASISQLDSIGSMLMNIHEHQWFLIKTSMNIHLCRYCA